MTMPELNDPFPTDGKSVKITWAELTTCTMPQEERSGKGQPGSGLDSGSWILLHVAGSAEDARSALNLSLLQFCHGSGCAVASSDETPGGSRGLFRRWLSRRRHVHSNCSQALPAATSYKRGYVRDATTSGWWIG